MSAITQNYGEFITMLFSTLDRKPVTDIDARNNYKTTLLEYCTFLYKLTPLPPNFYFASQRKYIDKLEVYLGRYMSIGSEFISDDKLESFLIELQDYMRDWVNDLPKMSSELYQLEKKFYSALAWDNAAYNRVNSNNLGFQNEQQESIEKLKSKINLPGFKQKYVNYNDGN